jgi:cytosine/adenosine deaminase-related metal-dependent hydrolase
MLTVVGTIIDAEGAEQGYVTLDASGHVKERGKAGTLGPPKGRVEHGIVLPRAVNGHTHLGDAVWSQEPPSISLTEIVAPPHGIKHLLLASTPLEKKIEAMRTALVEMGRAGVSLTVDFREEGVEGIRALRLAANGTGVEPFILGRPGDWKDKGELSRVLQEADGLGLSALRDMDHEIARRASLETHREGRFLALHASEDVREPIDPILDLKPSLLVHLTHATGHDLESVADSHCAVAFCPRSNALFGGFPPISTAVKLGIPFILGTDNLMFSAPDLFREMEFAYVSSRFHGKPVSPLHLVRAAFVTPWNILNMGGHAQLIPGSPAQALVLRLPGKDDPYYQVCARGTGAHILSGY